MNIRIIVVVFALMLSSLYMISSSTAENIEDIRPQDQMLNVDGDANNGKSTEEEIIEKSECAKEILDFVDEESIWDTTFIYLPGESCIVLKDNVWYDLFKENKFIMDQKL